MRLDVPLLEQSFPYTCGLVSLDAICQYFQKRVSFQEHYSLCIKHKGLSIAHLAQIALEEGLLLDVFDGTKDDLLSSSYSFDQLRSSFSNTAIPIVFLDWSCIENNSSFQGHFVPVVGFEEDAVLVHHESTAFFRIPTTVFLDAWSRTGKSCIYVFK